MGRDAYVTVKEAAEMLDVSLMTINRMWHRGDLQGYKASPSKYSWLRISRESITDVMIRRAQPPVPGGE